MWTVSECICLWLLIIAAIRDIQVRKVSVYILLGSGILCILYHLTQRQMSIWIVLGGALVGAAFLIISKVTREGIGYGDSFGILVLGVFLGFWSILIVLSMAFFLLLVVLIPLLLRKKMSRTYTLPFLPFLAGGYLGFLLMGGVSG